MIFTWIINMFLAIVSFLVNLLPSADSTVTTFLSSGLAGFISFIQAWDWIFPISTILWVIGVLIACEAILIGWKGIRLISNR